MDESATTPRPATADGFVRGAQGNIFPFLKVELGISYRTLGLHSSAFACGITLIGMFGPRLIGAFGRRPMLMVGGCGIAAAVVLLCLAPSALVTVASFGLLGLSAALIPTIVFATLADVHGERTPVAFNEAAATAAIFGVGAPLLTGLCIYLGLGWRSAALVCVAYGLAVLASFARVAMSESEVVSRASGGNLPLVYWVYWTALSFGIATEFCILLWAPTFLEGVVGLSEAAAATSAVAFALAMALGRLVGSRIVRFTGVPSLFAASVVVALVGFFLYWGTGQSPAAVLGLFVLGLGVSLFYPLAIGAAIEAAAADQRDKASARTAIAAGVAVLTMPALLGELAGRFGLHTAHLLVPTLVAAALVAFRVGRKLTARDAQ